MKSNNHIAIPVKDLEESKNFYEKLGFELFNQWGKSDQELKGIWIQDKSGYKIELVYHLSNRNLEYPKIIEVQHLGIAVENLENKIKELQENEIEIIIPPTKGVSVKQFAFIKDPNRFPIELVEY